MGEQSNGHCKDQPDGCTEFQLLRQEVKDGMSPKLEEIDVRSKATETKVDGFDTKLNRILLAVLAGIVTVIMGSGGIVAALLSK
jgi:hypothetical protein